MILEEIKRLKIEIKESKIRKAYINQRFDYIIFNPPYVPEYNKKVKYDKTTFSG